MKRNSLTTAVVAGIAGTVGIANIASAVNLNPDGLGQVLIYPYYTVNSNGSGDNLQTLFSVVNTTNQGKAIKVRFVEGYNSREVRDFHVYLSPYDVWTANLFKLPDSDAANLLTDDNSCTVPRIKGSTLPPLKQLPDGRSYLPFTNALFAGANNDGGPTGLERTREGHFEIIEMGTVVDDTNNSLTNITHINGVPKNCGAIVGAWVAQPPGYWIQDSSTDIEPPTGGLFGSALLVDVQNGVSAGYSADAIEGFVSNGIDNLHDVPGNTLPSLANIGGSDPTATAYVFDNGKLIQATYGAGSGRKIDAVSALFAHNDIFNEYVLGGGAAATTDWVVTFPTKNFYVDRAPPALAPFVEVFDGESKVQVGLFPYDREEGNPSACTGSDADNPNCGVCFSPCDPGDSTVPVLRYEAQVISFQTTADFTADPTSPVLGSQLASNVDVRADFLNNGWMRIALNPSSESHLMSPSSEGEVFEGLPVTGFAITNYVNANAAPGKLANYSGLWRHKGSRACSVPDPTAPLACS
ncbi:MAG TPA: hypothetical protein VFN25_05915 [Dokdonella sp.]|uniref:hypothetical protein n=1 Tax=Dokdonella sp. TaxID=2291710 RepID=UPI002D80CD52|nr:hypothetical protein [Dokdonella sp.]HET9032422.1 hypothetical protein [Dokdonella sp.]